MYKLVDRVVDQVAAAARVDLPELPDLVDQVDILALADQVDKVDLDPEGSLEEVDLAAVDKVLVDTFAVVKGEGQNLVGKVVVDLPDQGMESVVADLLYNS